MRRGLRLVPRWLIDSLYGSKDATPMYVYLGLLGLCWTVFALAAMGKISEFPARPGAIETFDDVRCEQFLPAPDGSATNSARETDAPCEDGLGEARDDFAQAREIADALREGTTAPSGTAAQGSPLRYWLDANVCRLDGASSFADRKGLAWQVRQGTGECGAWDSSVARFPFAVLLGVTLGLGVTVLLIFGAGIWAFVHGWRIPSTRKAYRRLFGSEHRAP